VRRLTSIYIHTAHLGSHTEITLHDVPNREYTLRLFVENVEKGLQKNDNHTWTPAQRQYVLYFFNTYTHQWMCVYRDVSPTTQVRAEVRMKIGHSVWTKYREANEVIGFDGLFSDYWSSTNHEFTVLSQSLSPTSWRICSDRKEQRTLSLESMVDFWNYDSLPTIPFVPWALVYYRQLILSA